jgi:hypothetical protein
MARAANITSAIKGLKANAIPGGRFMLASGMQPFTSPSQSSDS